MLSANKKHTAATVNSENEQKAFCIIPQQPRSPPSAPTLRENIQSWQTPCTSSKGFSANRHPASSDCSGPSLQIHPLVVAWVMLTRYSSLVRSLLQLWTGASPHSLSLLNQGQSLSSLCRDYLTTRHIFSYGFSWQLKSGTWAKNRGRGPKQSHYTYYRSLNRAG